MSQKELCVTTKVPRGHQLTQGLFPVFILAERSAWPTQQGHIDRTVSYCLLFLLLNPHAYWFWDFFFFLSWKGDECLSPVSVFEVMVSQVTNNDGSAVAVDFIRSVMSVTSTVAIYGEFVSYWRWKNSSSILSDKGNEFQRKKYIYISHTTISLQIFFLR